MSATFSQFAAVIAIGASIALPAAAETPLILPHNPAELRQMTSEPADSQCPQCGVVTSIRKGAEEMEAPDPGQNLAPSYMNDGPGDNIGAVPLLGRDAKEARLQMTPSSSADYLVTIRYDNGNYAVFEQQEKPDLRKGDRIKVQDGKVERLR